jgi:hypothetical protein
MRTSIPFERQPAQNQPARKPLSWCVQTTFALLAGAALLFSAPWLSAAQAPAAPAPSPAPAPAPAHKPVHPHKQSAAHQLATPPPEVPAKPVEPEKPDWPANDKPADASVIWDSHGLHIEAENSSLQQILDDVAARTGATVEGFDTDERVFGAYGPGPARDVLSQLLDGSGYNIIMIGDQGQGTPRQIVLSSRNPTNKEPGDKQTAAGESPPPAADEDSDADEQPEPQPPPRMRSPRPGFPPGTMPNGQPRTPQQIMQEMQQRQQNQPPNNPQN